MSNFKIYITCPMSVPFSTVTAVERLLHRMGADVRYWVRGTNYSDKNLRDTDAVVVILPDNNFSYEICDLPSGTKSEIKIAKELKKPVYIAYRSVTTGELGIYESVPGFGRISGAAGTTHKLSQIVKDYQNAKFAEKVVTYTVTPEEPKECELKMITPYTNIFKSMEFLHHRAMLVEQRINLVKPDRRLLIMLL